MQLEPIDLHHLTERVIGAYLLETDDGPRSSRLRADDLPRRR